MRCYERRSENLKRLGYETYPEYLQSDRWKKIRSRVLELSAGMCEVCDLVPASEVHHRSYSVLALTGKRLEWLIATCNECHFRAEFDEFGQKRTLSKANSAMNAEIWARGGRVPGQCVGCKKNPTKPRRELCGDCRRKQK